VKKIYAIGIALAVALCCIIAVDGLVKNRLRSRVEQSTYFNMDSRNSCDNIMDDIITENSIVVLGSSELSASDDLAYPPVLFNYGHSDFNMVLVGRGYMQSLQHAIDVGAFQNNIKNGKIVLIVSPQWFTASHISSEVFASRFDESMFVEFLRNDDISKKTKEAISNRINSLLESDPAELKRVRKYEDIYLYHNLNPVLWAEMSTYNLFREAKRRFELMRDTNKLNNPINYEKYVHVEEIDFFSLLKQAEEIGKEQCTNNEYGVYDDYFTKYIQEDYDSLKDLAVGASYATSIEYDDFRLFLDVCKETEIDPLIVNIPVNGRWYDYTGFPLSDREQYYQNIRNICEEYDVEIADFSDKEYEMYFLKDIMHLGWKGWVYLDEAVYRFYKGENAKARIER